MPPLEDLMGWTAVGILVSIAIPAVIWIQILYSWSNRETERQIKKSNEKSVANHQYFN